MEVKKEIEPNIEKLKESVVIANTNGNEWRESVKKEATELSVKYGGLSQYVFLALDEKNKREMSQ